MFLKVMTTAVFICCSGTGFAKSAENIVNAPTSHSVSLEDDFSVPSCSYFCECVESDDSVSNIWRSGSTCSEAYDNVTSDCSSWGGYTRSCEQRG